MTSTSTVTVTFNGQKRAFKFGGNVSGFNLSKTSNDKTSNPLKNFLNLGGNNTINVKSQAEYNNIIDFLGKADANKDGIIDLKDVTKLEQNDNGKDRPFTKNERQNVYYSSVEEVYISRDNKDGTSLNVIF